MDFAHLADLAMGEVFGVTRAKENPEHRVMRKVRRGRIGNILADDLILLNSPPSRNAYPNWLRRLVALAEVDGEIREMVFLTNNVLWSAQTITDLYGCRWSIEVFFQGAQAVAPTG